jgi:hypothetical protein
MTVLLRGDFDATQLRGFAKKTKDGPQARKKCTRRQKTDPDTSKTPHRTPPRYPRGRRLSGGRPKSPPALMASATLLRIAIPCHCHFAIPCHFATPVAQPTPLFGAGGARQVAQLGPHDLRRHRLPALAQSLANSGIARPSRSWASQP